MDGHNMNIFLKIVLVSLSIFLGCYSGTAQGVISGPINPTVNSIPIFINGKQIGSSSVTISGGIINGTASSAQNVIDGNNTARFSASDGYSRIFTETGKSIFRAGQGSTTLIYGPTNTIAQILVDDFGVGIFTMEGNPIFSGTPIFTNAVFAGSPVINGSLIFTNSSGASGGSILADAGDESFSVLDANGIQRINISPNGDPNGLGSMWLNDTNGNNWIQSLTGHGGVGFGDGKGGISAFITTNGIFNGIGSRLTNLNASQLTSGTVALNLLPSGVVTNAVPTNAVSPSVLAGTVFIPDTAVKNVTNLFVRGSMFLTNAMYFGNPSTFVIDGDQTTVPFAQFVGSLWLNSSTLTLTNAAMGGAPQIFGRLGDVQFAYGKFFASTNGDVFAKSFSGNGSGLTNLPAAQLTGNVPLAQLTNVFNGSTAVNGGGLTNVFGTNIISTPLKTTIQNGSPNTLVVTNGNVGIGTTSPSAQLTVASNIVAGTTLTATNGFISYGGYTDTNSGSGNSVQITNGNVTASGTFTGKGGGLTNLNPANLVGLFQNIVVSNTVTWTNNVTSTNWASVSVVSNQVAFNVQGNSIMTVTNIGTVGTPIWRTTVAGNNQSAASYFSSSTGNTSGGLFSNSGNGAQVGFDGNNEPSLYARYGQMVGYDNNVGATVFYDGSGGGTSIRYNHGGITDSALTNWITGTTVITIGNMATNVAAYTLVSSPTAVASSTSWTNVYGRQIQLIVDGIANMAVAGTGTLLFTNLTTTENHIVAGSTVSIAGATYFSDHETLSPNDIIQYVPTVTGSFTFTFSKTTVK